MATRVSARGMVGRSAELAELEAALSEAATGSPSIAFVAGESGLGKTRLLQALADRAREHHGARVLSGDCVELGDGELPYAPLVSALRPLARSGDPALDTLRPAVRADLGALALGLAQADDDAVRRDTQEPPQARLFEALLTLLAALSSDAPLLLIIEDLHWADPSTRSFLTFLAANLCDERVLVVGSYRPDELHRRHPLRPLLAELERDARARRFELLPMTRDELAQQLADILGAEPDDDLVDRMYRRSEGNPLFCEELLATGLDGRGTLPSSLRDALMMRVERLTPAAQQVLRLVAVARTLDHTTLAATGHVEPDVLRDAIAGHILITNGDGDYAFRHALLREVVDDDLLPGERADLHLRLAHALEGRAADNPSAQLLAHIAHHYSQSGDQPAALASAVRAAEASLPVHAYGEAAVLFERALELWDRVPDAEGLAGSGLVSLLQRTAMAYDMEGHIAREETLLRRALTLAEAAGDDRQTAGVLERVSRAEWALNCQDASLATLDRAMALMGDEPSADHAWLLAGKARYLMLMGRSRSAVNVARAARDESRVTGARRAERRSANALGVALMGLGDVDAGATVLREVIALAHQDEDTLDLCTALVNLADILHLAGRTQEALKTALEGYEETRSLGRQEVWLGLTVSECAFDAGDWALAERHLPDTRRRLQGTILLNATLRWAELSLGRGDHEAAGGYLEAAEYEAEGSREPQFIGVLGAVSAEYHRRNGDLAAARTAVDEALDRIEFCTDDVHRIARVAAVGVKVEADAAQQARDLGDSETERMAVARADLLIDRVRAAADAGWPVETAYLKTVLAERGRATGDDDPELWAAATEAWVQVQRPYLAAQTRAREAESFVTRSDRDAAAGAAADALRRAEDLGAQWLVAQLHGLVDRARLKLPGESAPQPGGVAPADAAETDPFGLTSRERQVLVLVARGATNREIGGELFMAEKTASVHVSRILAKLDVRTRTEAAAVAHRLGLYAS